MHRKAGNPMRCPTGYKGSCPRSSTTPDIEHTTIAHVLPSSPDLSHRPSRLPSQTLEQSIVSVIDDDVSLLRSLELLIDAAGWQPALCSFAEDLLARPRPSIPSCLVLDVLLPDFNGLDLQEHLAADRIVMPIMFITGHSDVPMTVRAMKGGAVEFLVST